MKVRLVAFLWLALAVFLAISAAAKTGDSKVAPATRSGSTQDDTARLQGEQRFRSNCGRCHAAPPKFSPRMTATIMRHMRVRATITDEDMRFIMSYMSR